MPRRLLGILLLLLGPAMYMHAQGDAVLMKVGAEEVGLKEFEYFYRRSLAGSPERFLQTFIDYKLKLQYAKELSLDTVQAYCLQKAFLCEAGLAKQEKRTTVERNREWVKLSHVTIPLNGRRLRLRLKLIPYIPCWLVETNGGRPVRRCRGCRHASC